MKKFWTFFFMFWPLVAIWSFVVAPGRNWWFPYNNPSATPLGGHIDDLFYLILVIVAITFVGTHVALGYVLWTGAREGRKAWFSHGSHNLEVIWTMVPAGILLFIALFQLPVVAKVRVKSRFPDEARIAPIAEVTARQFEWRIRYPSLETYKSLKTEADVQDWLANPRPDDLYSVNDLHVPTGVAVQIRLKSGDVQHALFVPEFRVKQDAVPGLAIPVWFEVQDTKDYDESLKGVPYEMLCAELCGWGHYKMKARVVTHSQQEFENYLKRLREEQFNDGYVPPKKKQAKE